MQDHRKSPAGGSVGPSSVLKYGNNSRSPGQSQIVPVWDLMRYLWVQSTLEGLRKCHRVRYGPHLDVYRQDVEVGPGKVFFKGFCRCHSVWACPLCAPTIRRGRAESIAADLVAAVGAGRGLVFATFTLPHDQGTDLGRLFSTVARGWDDVKKDRTVRQIFGDYGADFVKATEVTYGQASGFHPHHHASFVLKEPLSREQVKELRLALYEPWCRSVERAGFRRPSFKHGVHTINVRRGAAAARNIGNYVSKIEGLAQELTRLDQKTGGKTLAPFEVLHRAALGEDWAQVVWKLYEQGTKGRRAVAFSETWRERVSSLVQPSDAEIVASETAGARWIGRLDHNEADALSIVPNGFEMFMELAGEVSPEAFRNAAEWLCAQVPFFETERGWRGLERQIAAELSEADRAALAEELRVERLQEVLF